MEAYSFGGELIAQGGGGGNAKLTIRQNTVTKGVYTPDGDDVEVNLAGAYYGQSGVSPYSELRAAAESGLALFMNGCAAGYRVGTDYLRLVWLEDGWPRMYTVNANSWHREDAFLRHGYKVAFVLSPDEQCEYRMTDGCTTHIQSISDNVRELTITMPNVPDVCRPHGEVVVYTSPDSQLADIKVVDSYGSELPQFGDVVFGPDTMYLVEVMGSVCRITKKSNPSIESDFWLLPDEEQVWLWPGKTLAMKVR